MSHGNHPARAAFRHRFELGKIDVKPGKAAGYRFFPTQPRDLMEYATLKRRLDVAAAYLAFVFIA